MNELAAVLRRPEMCRRDRKKSKHPQDSPFPARPVANGRADRAALFSERVARSGSFLYGTFDAASGTFSHLPARGSANGRRMRAACAISCAAVLCAPSLTYFRIAKYFMRLFYEMCIRDSVGDQRRQRVAVRQIQRPLVVEQLVRRHIRRVGGMEAQVEVHRRVFELSLIHI